MSNSEVNQEVSSNVEQTESVSIEQLQAELEAKNAEFDAVKAKMNELLDETKKAKAAKREAEQAAKIRAEEKARKEGDFEQLLKSSEAERQKLYEELNGLRTSITREKITNESLKIAGELAKGSNAEILSEFISRRLQYTDDGIKVLDESGNLTIATIDQLKNEFRSNPKFKSLVDGRQSTGGGATQTDSGAVDTNSKTAQEIRDMDPLERGKFFAKGGQVRQEL